MASTIQLTFYIYLTDQAQVAALQAQYPLGVSRGPLPAATEFGAPFIAEGSPITYPCTRTGWMPPGASGKFPLDRAFFTINDGWFGHLFGRDQKYAWIGQFVYQTPTDQDVSGTAGVGAPGVMLEVAFARGFEDSPIGSNNGSEGDTTVGLLHGRDGSRTIEGLGGQLRAASQFDQISWNVLGATPIGRGWERFYMRIRTLPTTGDCTVWRMRWSSGNNGMALFVNTSGALQLKAVTSGGSIGSAMGSTSSPLEVGVWHCIDIVHAIGVNATFGNIQSADVWVDHVQVINADAFLHGEGAISPTTNNSLIGVGIGSHNNAEIDFDDHVGFITPIPTAAIYIGRVLYWTETQRPGVDWINGHHVARVDAHVYDATHSAAGWGTGDVRALRQVGAAQQAEDVLTSTTSGALAAANTYGRLVAEQDGSLGWQALLCHVLMRRATAGTPQLGVAYSETSGGSTTTAMSNCNNVGTTNQWSQAAVRPTGLTAPKALYALMLRFTKAADANSTQIAGMYGSLLLVGNFDQCDLSPDPTTGDVPVKANPLRYGIHNAPYPRSQYVRTDVPPDSPVWVKAGTYTGNALGQDVIAKIPAHFWWIRNTSAVTGAARWWSSMIGAKWAVAGDVRGGMNRTTIDPEFTSPGGDTDSEDRTLIRVGGSNAAANANTNVYQYLAIGDPGARFMLNDACNHANAVTTFDNHLADPDFLAEACFAATEFPSGGGFLWFKGPGDNANSGHRLDLATDQTTFGAFLTGIFRTLVTLHPSGTVNTPFSLWRQRDGADYAGLGITEPVVVQIMSYAGDGAASRTIQLPRTSGKRPMWAIVVPQNTNLAAVRDPTHTTNTSSVPAAGNVTITTGITGGGIDSISVGSTLNSNGVGHSVFVVMAADATAGNNGWGTNGEVLYDPVPAPGGQWPDGYDQDALDELENPTVPPEVESFDDGPDLADDLADTVCVPFTLRAVNLALSRIGISDMVATAAELQTPTSQERSLVVQFYETTLRYVLRDYPWAHATRYASLALLEGSISDPVNADWVYSFRAPSACLFVRRVIRPELGRKHDAKPPAFRMAVDDVGPLLYVTDDGVQFDSNDEPFVEIEYTIRPGCGARAGGDQKFVSAFAFRLAFELATALSRDEKTIQRMERGYLIEKSSASTTVGNEQQQQPPGDPDWLLGR